MANEQGAGSREQGADERYRSIAEAVALIRGRLAVLAQPGFYGSLPLVLKMQDGFVDTVHFTGVEEYKKIPRHRAA